MYVQHCCFIITAARPLKAWGLLHPSQPATTEPTNSGSRLGSTVQLLPTASWSSTSQPKSQRLKCPSKLTTTTIVAALARQAARNATAAAAEELRLPLQLQLPSSAKQTPPTTTHMTMSTMSAVPPTGQRALQSCPRMPTTGETAHANTNSMATHTRIHTRTPSPIRRDRATPPTATRQTPQGQTDRVQDSACQMPFCPQSMPRSSRRRTPTTS